MSAKQKKLTLAKLQFSLEKAFYEHAKKNDVEAIYKDAFGGNYYFTRIWTLSSGEAPLVRRLTIRLHCGDNSWYRLMSEKARGPRFSLAARGQEVSIHIDNLKMLRLLHPQDGTEAAGIECYTPIRNKKEVAMLFVMDGEPLATIIAHAA